MKDRIAIAIDGPVAAGKTTIGRMLAQRLDALMFDSGIVYRAVALETLRRGVDPHDTATIAKIAETLDLNLADGNGETRVLLSGQRVTDELRTPEVDRTLPPIAANPEVRRALLPVQRRIAANGPIVVVGRDIGTVILPDADLKIYLDADPDVRALRRYEELSSRGVDASLDGVLRDLQVRDERDLTRSHAPLEIASDAVTIDATDLTAEQVVERIVSLVGDLSLGCESHRSA